jgi:hypothetical protein
LEGGQTGRTAPLTAVLWYNGEPHQWRAELRKGCGGWRVWSVAMLPWCGAYSRCGVAPTPTIRVNCRPV